jgi:hypothetical protein
MTEEEHKKYEEKRKVIEAMNPDERMKRLDEISTEVFIMANSFAGDQEGIPEGLGVALHQSVNKMMQAQKMYEGKIPGGIPMDAIMSACGLDNTGVIDLLAGMSEPGYGTSMTDLQIKDDQYSNDLENKSDE